MWAFIAGLIVGSVGATFALAIVSVNRWDKRDDEDGA